MGHPVYLRKDDQNGLSLHGLKKDDQNGLNLHGLKKDDQNGLSLHRLTAFIKKIEITERRIAAQERDKLYFHYRRWDLIIPL